jgi:exosortase
MNQTANLDRSQPRLLAALAAACLLTTWAFWTTLAEVAQRWNRDPSYSHGWLVPLFAVYLLWARRDRLDLYALSPTWWGLPILAAGVALRLMGAYFHYVWFDPISLLPCLAGTALLVGGWAAWRWSWPALAFLAFMIPLPYSVAIALTDPLQRVATIASTFLLQTLGVPALAEGKVILLSEVELGIVEACSGLRMLMIFFALSAAVVLVVKRPVGEKLLILASAAPIALLCNILRITATGLLHELVSSEWANAVFHDFAGWVMMPLGLAFLGVELWILNRLWIEELEGERKPARVLGPFRVAPTGGWRSPSRTRPAEMPPQIETSRPLSDQPKLPVDSNALHCRPADVSDRSTSGIAAATSPATGGKMNRNAKPIGKTRNNAKGRKPRAGGR